MLNNFKIVYNRRTNPEKLAFWLVIITGLALGIYTGLVIPKIIIFESLPVTLTYSIPLVLSMFAFISAGMILSGRVIDAVWLVLGSNWVGMLVISVLAEGYSFTPALWILVLAVLIAPQISDKNNLNRLLVYSAFSAVATILIDLYWYAERIKVSPVEVLAANYIAASMTLILVVYVFLKFRSFPLRVKLIISFLALTLISVGVVAAQNLTITSRTLSASIGAQVSRAAEEKASVLGNELSRTVNLLIITSYDSNLQLSINEKLQAYSEDRETRTQVIENNTIWQQAYDSDRNHPLIYDRLTNQAATNLRVISSRAQSLGDLFVIDRYGALVGTEKIFPQYDFANEDWWQTTFNEGKGAVFIGLPQYNPEENKVTLLIAVPIIDRIGNYIIGILGTNIHFEQLNKKLRADLSLLGENVDLDLIFPGTPPLVFNEVPVPIGNSDKHIDEALLLANNLDNFQMNYAGQDSVVSIATVNDINSSDYLTKLDWKIAVHNPTVDAYAPVETQRRASLAILVLIASIGTIGAIGLAQVLSNPLQRLSEVAQRFGTGNLDIRANIDADDEIGSLANEFNKMADQIKQILAGLENEVAERTHSAVISAEVSRRLSTILDQQQLLLSVVEEIQRAFNFYHAQVYLFDESYENLVLMGGTGEAGKSMLAKGHKIPRAKGLVGRAAERNSIVLVSDTSKDPNWLPNPLLPETKSEVAVPITIGEQVIGVLDVQHNEKHGLTTQIANLLQSIANQVAIAVQNARLYTQAQKQADREAKILTISQKIQAESTLDGVIEAAARELGTSLSVLQASVHLDINPKNLQKSARESLD